MSRSKDNRIMNMTKIIFLKNNAENEADLFLLSRKALYEVRGCSLVSIYFDSPQLGIHEK